MEWSQLALLVGSGLAAGYLAGLIGVGGGVIFAPVLFFYFEATRTAPDVIAPLTIGTSLFCTIIAALTSAWFQYRERSVHLGVALKVGLFSGVAVFLMATFVTTQPWFDGRVYQVVFSLILLVIVARMLAGGERSEAVESEAEDRGEGPVHGTPMLASTGMVSGIVAAASGVGGGVILVPVYNNVFRIPIRAAVGTSSATIVISSMLGVLNYALIGWDASTPGTAVGYVDFLSGLVLALPSVLTARAGVWTAHRIRTRALRWSFGIIAAIVAVRLILRAL